MMGEAEAQLAVQIESLRSEQNLVGGISAGLVAAVAGASAWAAITAATEYQIGWMAIGVGFLVGFAMKTVGKGIDPIFGYAGAALSLIGCALGNYFTVAWFVSAQEGIGFLELLSSLGPAEIVELMSLTFDPMDLLFYGIAVYFGYRYSFRVLVPAAPAAEPGP